MELRQLEAFIVVAEELHFGRAAARLLTAQPALSQRIRRLEIDLGVQLFERNTRSVRLTPAGAALLEHSRTVMETVDVARGAARAAGRGDAGIVRIGYGGATYNEVIPRVVRAVRVAYPGIELRLESNLLSGRAFDKVADREIDIGFGRLPGSRFGVRTQLLARERLVVALPSDHPMAGERVIALAQLRDELFVAPPASDGSSVRDLLVHSTLDAGFSPRIVQEAPDSLTLLSLVAAGVGVTLTLSALQFYKPEGLTYLPLEEEIPVDSVMLWHEANSSRAVHAVLRLIVATVAEAWDDAGPRAAPSSASD